MTEEALIQTLIYAALLIGFLLMAVILIGLQFILYKFLIRKLSPHVKVVSPFIAERYLFSVFNKFDFNLINAITGISIFGITIGSASLIIVLSIFNGFHTIIDQFFSKFDPDIKVVAAKGKTMSVSEEVLEKIRSTKGVEYVSYSIENKAMMKYYDKQHVAVIKGIRSDYPKVSPVHTTVYDGDFAFYTQSGAPMVVLGGGVAWYLSASLNDRTHPVKILAPPDDIKVVAEPIVADVFPAGYFSIQKEYDDQFALVDYKVAEKLFDFKGKCTAYEVRIKPGASPEKVRDALKASLGDRFSVMTRYEQHKTLFEVMKNEKLVAYLVLTLMLIVAGVNIVGNLSMIVLKKTKDVSILKSMGAGRPLIMGIFLFEGFLIGMIGGTAGTLLGGLFCILQKQFNIIRINSDSFIVEGFPVEPYWPDFLVIFLTVFGLSVLAAVYPAFKAGRQNIVEGLRR